MYYASYEDLVRDVVLGGAARKVSAIKMAEKHAGERLKWREDGSLQTARSMAGIVYHVYSGGGYDRGQRSTNSEKGGFGV